MSNYIPSRPMILAALLFGATLGVLVGNRVVTAAAPAPGRCAPIADGVCFSVGTGSFHVPGTLGEISAAAH